jgi:hypothetical protein
MSIKFLLTFGIVHYGLILQPDFLKTNLFTFTFKKLI